MKISYAAIVLAVLGFTLTLLVQAAPSGPTRALTP
jgi:hypothetical protein